MRNFSYAVLAALFLVPISASATAPRVALHRSEVVGYKAKTAAAIHELVAAELAQRGVHLASSDEVASFFEGRSYQSCLALSQAKHAKCLAKLASTVGADRTVAVTLSTGKGKILLSAVDVSRDGKVLQSIPPVEYPRASNVRIEAALKDALPDFVARLDVVKPPPSALTPKLQASPETTVAGPGLAVSAKVSPVDARASRRTFGIASLAAGAAFAGLGTWQTIAGSAGRAEFESTYADGARPSLADRDRLAQLRSSATRAQTLGGVGLGLGAVAVGTGLYLLLTSTDAPSSNTTVLVGPSSVGVSVPLR